MVELQSLAPTFVAGLLLGTIFFGGLWWTVRGGLTAEQPALWFLGSLILRTCIAVGGFFLVAGDVWERWLACLIGFMVARFALNWLTREVGDAP